METSLHISGIRRTNELNIKVFSVVTNKVCMLKFSSEKHNVARMGGIPFPLQWGLK